ncbi:hypothetical protein CIL05_00175 [Virgibacillus profundi]|uniref:Putative 4-hydroxy-4-methyl-2-oxoglutarate aldolase n=1 Tax=Virgibacillus profundi TaxID=2024555 RepID=A0A2A2IGJ2_9BACI|nr:RraA family protein [Virgibacillus profundi]PAV31111.1 hypothetical protein CIL05_00175 [Virgibacillus profundi]PXY55294.1 4-hydroxy-4-methyl-2-oxoglutarate aldolase [Virgibacillus profundi]
MHTKEIKDENTYYSSATFHEAAGKIGALPSEIKPLANNSKLFGRITPVLSPPGDNLWLHKAVYEAEPGTILVVDVSGHYEAGYWGEILNEAAKERGIKGLVINGCVRDSEQLVEMDFPVFARGICIRGTSKDKNSYGSINEVIRIGDTQLFPNDYIIGDADGCVVIPQKQFKEIEANAVQREEEEIEILKALKDGESSLDIYNLR